MKYTEKRLEQFDIRKVLPFTMGYAQRHPHEMESTVADKINAEVNYAIAQAEQEGYQRGVKEARSHYYERVRMEAEQEMLKRVVGEIKCGECNGSGAYSSPSDHSPCRHCEGTGVYIDGSLNDFLSSLDKEIINPKE